MGWQSTCHRCGAEVPHRRPLTVEFETDNGHATRHSLKCYCSECAPLILAALNEVTASESRQS